MSNRGVRNENPAEKQKTSFLSRCVDPSKLSPALLGFMGGLDYPQSPSTRIDELRINMVHNCGTRFQDSFFHGQRRSKIPNERHVLIARSLFVAPTQVWGKIGAVPEKRETFSNRARRAFRFVRHARIDPLKIEGEFRDDQIAKTPSTSRYNIHISQGLWMAMLGQFRFSNNRIAVLCIANGSLHPPKKPRTCAGTPVRRAEPSLPAFLSPSSSRAFNSSNTAPKNDATLRSASTRVLSIT